MAHGTLEGLTEQRLSGMLELLAEAGDEIVGGSDELKTLAFATLISRNAS